MAHDGGNWTERDEIAKLQAEANLRLKQLSETQAELDKVRGERDDARKRLESRVAELEHIHEARQETLRANARAQLADRDREIEELRTAMMALAVTRKA